MITSTRIETVKEEMHRFHCKLVDLEKRLKFDSGTLSGCKESGAVKRASMDLSRALIELRK